MDIQIKLRKQKRLMSSLKNVWMNRVEATYDSKVFHIPEQVLQQPSSLEKTSNRTRGRYDETDPCRTLLCKHDDLVLYSFISTQPIQTDESISDVVGAATNVVNQPSGTIQNGMKHSQQMSRTATTKMTARVDVAMLK